MMITINQIQILLIIKEGNPDGTHVTVYDIIDRMPTNPRRDSVLHSISPLINEGYVERVDGPVSTKGGRSFRSFALTEKGSEIV